MNCNIFINILSTSYGARNGFPHISRSPAYVQIRKWRIKRRIIKTGGPYNPIPCIRINFTNKTAFLQTTGSVWIRHEDLLEEEFINSKDKKVVEEPIWPEVLKITRSSSKWSQSLISFSFESFC